MTPEHHATALAEIVRRFNTLEMDAIMSCFTDDVVTRYNGLRIDGRDALGAFLAPRYADLSDYTLEKIIRMAEGDALGVEAVARYTRRSTGTRVTSLIHEFLNLRAGRICRWDYVGHVYPDSGPVRPSQQ